MVYVPTFTVNLSQMWVCIYKHIYTPYMKHIWYTPTQTLQDISLSARILATFPDYVSAAQRVEDLDPPDKKIQSLRWSIG